MKVFLAFAVLLAGIAAVSANLVEPQRYRTDMTSLMQGDGRISAFSAVAALDKKAPPIGTRAQASPQSEGVTAFKTTLQVAEDKISPGHDSAAPEIPAYVPTADVSALDAATRSALARDIQSELARLGCYAGAIDGVWSPETQRAASLFVTEANARIPVSEPDFALFSLAKTATEQQACGPAATIAQAPAIAPPAMALGGPGVVTPEPKAASYHRDRDVDSLFTNPLGR